MKKFRFLIKLPDNKQFNYKPRYYDAQKEELKERLKALQNDRDATKARISAAFRRARYEARNSENNFQILLRRAIIFTIIFLLLYSYMRGVFPFSLK